MPNHVYQVDRRMSVCGTLLRPMTYAAYVEAITQTDYGYAQLFTSFYPEIHCLETIDLTEPGITVKRN